MLPCGAHVGRAFGNSSHTEPVLCGIQREHLSVLCGGIGKAVVATFLVWANAARTPKTRR